MQSKSAIKITLSWMSGQNKHNIYCSSATKIWNILGYNLVVLRQQNNWWQQKEYTEEWMVNVQCLCTEHFSSPLFSPKINEYTLRRPKTLRKYQLAELTQEASNEASSTPRWSIGLKRNVNGKGTLAEGKHTRKTQIYLGKVNITAS